MGTPPNTMRLLVCPCRHSLRHVPSLLPQRAAWRARDNHGPGARDALLSRVVLLRGALRLPYGVVPRVHGAQLPCDDALLLSLTSFPPAGCRESHRVKSSVTLGQNKIAFQDRENSDEMMDVAVLPQSPFK